jgi:serine/threonine protein kinase/tetratricopeptide (TPR) repeat protein
MSKKMGEAVGSGAEGRRAASTSALDLARPETAETVAPSVCDTSQELPPLPPPPQPAAKAAREFAAAMLQKCTTAEPPTPPTIPGYEILGKLGRGGMGVVYQARQLRLNRLVAIKMVLSGAQADPQELTRFRTEVESIARLQHPNIVQVLEAGEQNGCPYYALEFVDGGSLAHKLAGKPQPARRSAQFVETIARAVQFAHQHGIVHRDLKPANVLLAHSDRQGAIALGAGPGETRLYDPKITDFGLAKQLGVSSAADEQVHSQDGQTQTGEMLGTPSYMAPEQAAGTHDRVGPAADVYALGAILYEMLTGRPPFLGVTALETLRQVQDDEPVPPARLQSDVPRDLDTICLKCLQKDPQKRYADGGQLADDLRRFLDGEPIAARPVAFWVRAYKWTKRRPAWTALIAVSGAAAALLGVGGWWSYVKVSGLAAELAWQAQRAERSAQVAQTQRLAAERREHEAEKLSEERDAQRRLADANLRQLGTVIDKMIEFGDRLRQAGARRGADASEQESTAEFSMDPAISSISTDDVIKEMQASARSFYERFVQQQSDDPEVQAEKGRAFRRLAAITARTGKKSEAAEQCDQAIAVFSELVRNEPDKPSYALELVQSYRQAAAISIDLKPDRQQAVELLRRALEVQERLVRDYPKNTVYATELAATCHNLGGNYCDRFEFQKAEPLLYRAIELWEAISKEQPQNTSVRSSIASTQSILGRLYRNWKRWDEAETFYRQALELRMALLRTQPDEAERKYEVADSHYWLGGMYYATDRLEEAEQQLRAALAIQQELHGADSARTSFTVALGRTQLHMGRCVRDRGAPDASLEHLDAAIELLKSAAEKDHKRAALFLGGAYLSRSESLARLGRQAESEQDWRLAFQLDPTASWRNQLERAEKHASSGQHARATDTVDRLAKEKESNNKSTAGTRYFAMAGIYALSIPAALRDDTLAENTRSQLADEYTRQSLRWLGEAHRVGFFKNPARAEQLRDDSKFDAIRSLDPFQKFLSDLGL